jgi:hypothetical protein
MKQISTYPNNVILTGLLKHRFISIYKSKEEMDPNAIRKNSFGYESQEAEDENYSHFMPGIDILFGYNLLNIAHHNFENSQVKFLFPKPALVKTLYYPSFSQDSLDKKPINRDYYLVSVYDEDTNKDKLINKKDLRRFYHFDINSNHRTSIVPENYSVLKSQYDSKNDFMYIFAGYDANKNGSQDKSDPIQVFWIDLKVPGKGKLLY